MKDRLIVSLHLFACIKSVVKFTEHAYKNECYSYNSIMQYINYAQPNHIAYSLIPCKPSH